MEIEKYLELDIEEFLNREVEKRKSKINIAREEEFEIFTLQKDYARELRAALKSNDLEKAQGVFNELKIQYDKIPEGTGQKKRVYKVLTELYDIIRKYLENQSEHKSLFQQILELEKQGFFHGPPVTAREDVVPEIEILRAPGKKTPMREVQVPVAAPRAALSAPSTTSPATATPTISASPTIAITPPSPPQEVSVNVSLSEKELRKLEKDREDAKRDIQELEKMKDEQKKLLQELKGISSMEKKAIIDIEKRKVDAAVERFKESQERLQTLLTSHDIPSAKKEYGRLKEAFQSLPITDPKLKKSIRDQILKVYEQIRKASTVQEEPVITKLPSMSRMLNAVESAIEQDLPKKATEALLEAKHAAETHPEGVIFRKRMDELQRRIHITRSVPKTNKRQFNEDYFRAVYLMHHGRYDEAISLLQDLQAKKPRSKAVRIRLYEAMNHKKIGE